MRLVEGRDLREVIGLDGRLDAHRATRIVAQVASALDAAHARGLVHRDVKPANVLLAGSPGSEHAYLTDFGIAKRQETSALTQTGQVLGTIDYAAPEQISGETVDARTDVYALGCLLCEAPSTPPTLPAPASPPPSEPPPSSPGRQRWPLALAGVLLLIAGAAAPCSSPACSAPTTTAIAPSRASPPRASPRPRRLPPPPRLLPHSPAARCPRRRPTRSPTAMSPPTRPRTSMRCEPSSAPEAQLSGPGTSANGREEVLSEYRSTFALIEDPRYELGNRTYAEQPTSSMVQGDYDVTDSATGATPSGRLVLTMQRIDEQPLITRITTG